MEPRCQAAAQPLLLPTFPFSLSPAPVSSLPSSLTWYLLYACRVPGARVPVRCPSATAGGQLPLLAPHTLLSASLCGDKDSCPSYQAGIVHSVMVMGPCSGRLWGRT